MNKLAKISTAAVTGTAAMTAGSELMSLLFKENFSEPDHLETMISRVAPHLSEHAKKIAGWGAHLAMGFVFATVFVELWETKKIKHNFKNALILGTVGGVLGLLIWKGTFKAHPLPPFINYGHYYLQRIPAHIIFSVAATIAYKLTLHEDLIGGEKEVKSA
jgi:hypothetical protein